MKTIEYTTDLISWYLLSASPQGFGATINPIPFVQWKNKALSLSLSSSLSDCVIDTPNLSTKSLLTYDTATSKWINSNSIPISGYINNWSLCNVGFPLVNDWFTLKYGGVDKMNIDPTGKMTLYSITGNNWEIGNATLTLNIINNYAKKWDIGVNNDNLRFNADYTDRVIFDRLGNISSRALNMSNYNGIVCSGASEFAALQNIGSGTTGQILKSNGSSLPTWTSSTNINKTTYKYTIKYDAYDASLMDTQNHVHFDSAYYVHVFDLNNTVSSPSTQGDIYLPNKFSNGQYCFIQFSNSAPYGLHVHTDDYIIVTDSSGSGFNPAQIFYACTFKVTYWTENNNPWNNIP